MRDFLSDKKKAIVAALIYVIGAIYILVRYNDGIGLSADSYLHFLFAKYSWTDVSLLFTHWAKPVFTLLASPFAQFGFIGMKVFNITVVLLTFYFIYKCSFFFNLKNKWLSVLFSVFAPFYFIISFTSLTEPLFALFSVIGLYLTLKNQNVKAAIIISFLPFIRSEGLIIIGVWLVYYVFTTNWRIIPWLLFGNIIYAIAGYPIYYDFLWTFTKIPYAHTFSNYGNSSNILHFPQKLILVLGVPIFVFFWIGVVKLITDIFMKKWNSRLHILVLGGFMSIFIAHSLFWYLGIFHSMGLKRVLIAIIPFASLIAVIGFNFIYSIISKYNIKLASYFLIGICLYVVIFPFTPNHAGIKWNRDFSLSKSEKIADNIGEELSEKYGTKGIKYFYSNPYFYNSLRINPFDKFKRENLVNIELSTIEKGSIIIWDNWFSVIEDGMQHSTLDNIPNLELIQKVIDEKIHFRVYVVK